MYPTNIRNVVKRAMIGKQKKNALCTDADMVRIVTANDAVHLIDLVLREPMVGNFFVSHTTIATLKWTEVAALKTRELTLRRQTIHPLWCFPILL